MATNFNFRLIQNKRLNRENRDHRGRDHVVVGFITSNLCNQCLSTLML